MGNPHWFDPVRFHFEKFLGTENSDPFVRRKMALIQRLGCSLVGRGVVVSRLARNSLSTIVEADVFGPATAQRRVKIIPKQPPPVPNKAASVPDSPNNAKRDTNSNDGAVVIKNEQIRYPELRVVFDKVKEGEPKWAIMTKQEALTYAKKAKLDLILVSESVSPPICKMAVAATVVKEKRKAESELKARERARTLKEIVIGALIDPHDLEHKVKRIKDFLESGHPVKLTISILPKEIKTNPTALGSAALRVISAVEGFAKVTGTEKGQMFRKEFMLSLLKN